MLDSAAAMDAIYRRQRFIYDLTRRPYLFGRDQMLAELEPPPGGSVLEIGCGTARNLLCAARLYPDAEFFGIDVSEQMLKTARASIDRSPFRESIRVAHADATTFCPRSAFRLYAADRIFISYALSMIPASGGRHRAGYRPTCTARRTSHRRFRNDGRHAAAAAPDYARLVSPVQRDAVRRFRIRHSAGSQPSPPVGHFPPGQTRLRRACLHWPKPGIGARLGFQAQ